MTWVGSVGSVKRGRRLSQDIVSTFVRFYYLISMFTYWLFTALIRFIVWIVVLIRMRNEIWLTYDLFYSRLLRITGGRESNNAV